MLKRRLNSQSTYVLLSKVESGALYRETYVLLLHAILQGVVRNDPAPRSRSPVLYLNTTYHPFLEVVLRPPSSRKPRSSALARAHSSDLITLPVEGKGIPDVLDQRLGGEGSMDPPVWGGRKALRLRLHRRLPRKHGFATLLLLKRNSSWKRGQGSCDILSSAYLPSSLPGG